MFSDRVVVRSNTDNHIMFKVFKAYYSDCSLGVQPVYDHRHSELEISAILTGSGVYKCSENEYMFRAGDVFMHCGNDNHQFLRIDEELSMVVIQFEPRLIWSGGEWFEPKYLRLFTEKIRINTQRSNQEDGFFQKKYTASAASARPVTTMRNTRPHSASASMLKAAPSFST